MIEIIWKIMLGTLITSCIGSCVKKLFMIFSNNKNKLDHIAQVRLSLFGINYFLQFTDPISFTFWLNYSWYQLKLFNAKEWQYSTETRSYDSTLCKLKIFQIYSLLFFYSSLCVQWEPRLRWKIYEFDFFSSQNIARKSKHQASS